MHRRPPLPAKNYSAQAASMKSLVKEFMVFIDGEKARQQDVVENKNDYEVKPPLSPSKKAAPQLSAANEYDDLFDSDIDDLDF